MLRFDPSLIENELPPVFHTSIIAHYTRIGTLSHFISPGQNGWICAWASPVQFLNDRKELLVGLEKLFDVASQKPLSGQIVRSCLESLLMNSGGVETDAFQMSFSGDPDELGQWRGYASNGMGCAVVTNAQEGRKIADVSGWVLYDTKKQVAFSRKVLAKLRNQHDIRYVEQVLIASACFMKDNGFRSEKEFRMLKFPEPKEVHFRESGDRLVPYIDCLSPTNPLTIQQITIGPGWQLSQLPINEFARHHVVQAIGRLLALGGLHTTITETSDIPYDPK